MNKILENFNGLKVLVVGDVMIDSYYFGKVERISPEAPVPVVAVNKKETRLGGAANVAMNLIALGAKPVLCSVIGDDNDGDDMMRLLEEAGIGASGIVRSKDRITTVKTRVIGQNTQMLRIDSEMTGSISEVDSYQLVERIYELLIDADVLIFEDYDKGVLTQENIKQIIDNAKKADVPVVVDPKKRNFNYYHGADLFKPNLKELKEGIHADVDTDNKQAFEGAIHKLMKEMNLKSVMVTLSEKGVMISNGSQVHYIPAHVRKIADVSGAGDTVISVASLCVALNIDPDKTATLSNLAGGLVCEEVGVIPIDKKRLSEEATALGL